MKKATATGRVRTITLEQLKTRKLTRKQLAEITALAALPDEQIDLTDIPEIDSAIGWSKNPLYGRRHSRSPLS
jgi:hypothetical protein